MTNLCVIASARPWNMRMPDKLRYATGRQFELICSHNELTVENLKKLNPRYVFFPHWSHIIPVEVVENFECIVFHMTDLPFGRGGSPLQNLIERGIYETKISALKCEAEIDAGPIYIKRPFSLYGTAEEIYLRASDVIENMIVEIVNTNPQPIAQTGQSTHFKRRNPEQGNMLETGTLDRAFDLIRMLDAEGYPHAYINVGNFRLEFTRASRKVDSLVADVRITVNGENKESDN